MQPDMNLIPPAPTVRERLARNLRERRLLRALLRLSIQAAEERARQAAPSSHHEADGREGGHDA